MVRRNVFSIVLALFFAVSAAKADEVILDGSSAGTFDLPDGTGFSLSPYGGTLNGQAVQFICVDQSVGVKAGSSWEATVYSLPNGPFGNTVQQNQITYEEMAYLATQMLNALADGQAGVATAYQFAIWSFTGGPDPFLTSNPQFDNESLLAQAAAAVAGGYNGSGWEIVTPNAGQVGQEMLVQTPEPSSLMLLCFGLAGILGLVRRQRIA